MPGISRQAFERIARATRQEEGNPATPLSTDPRQRQTPTGRWVKVTTAGVSGVAHVTESDDEGNVTNGREYQNVQVSNNETAVADDLGVLVRDKTGQPLFVPHTVGSTFAVKVTKDGGSAGTSSTDCTFTYTVKDLNANTLDTLVSPERPRFDSTIYLQPAADSYGIAFMDGSTLVLLEAIEEIQDTTVCP